MIDDVLGAGEGRRDIEVPLLLPGECLEGADATATDLLEDVALVKLDGTRERLICSAISFPRDRKAAGRSRPIRAR